MPSDRRAHREQLRQEGRLRAQQTRAELGLGAGPIPDVFAIVEQQGVFLVRYPSGDPDLHAFYGAFENRSVVYVNSNESLGRQIFSAAHELCHFKYDSRSLHQVRCNPGGDQEDEVEIIADAFAGEFLMPEDRVRLEYYKRFGFRKPTERDVINLMQEFRVSYAAMAYMMFKAGVIKTGGLWNTIRQLGSVENHQALRGALLRQGFSTDLIEPTPPRFPRVFLEAAISNFDEGIITWNKLESLLEPWGKRPEDYDLRPHQELD